MGLGWLVVRALLGGGRFSFWVDIYLHRARGTKKCLDGPKKYRKVSKLARIINESAKKSMPSIVAPHYKKMKFNHG